MMRKAICLFIVGEKYRKMYDKSKKQFENYARKCGADIKVIDKPLDGKFHRPLLSQKLLIPDATAEYDVVLFLDLDIIISEEAPSVFDYLPENKYFGAVLDPRGTEEFNKTWGHIPRILEETNEIYFTDRHFENNDLLQGSINGGVFIFRPQKVAGTFKDYYFSDHNQGELNSFEETPFAYFSQIHNWFKALPIQFNTQILYKLKGTEEGREIIKKEKKLPKFFLKYYYKKTGNCMYPTRAYKNYVKRIITENHFVHFSGNYPIIYN
ncbi:glycosyltransferase [uncultured Chryseobacterium sp.]|uniref:glycosyltransferase n=1 Tax=uncultured Chryseobacterium sp. TaxID=259322 RepID=UPI00258C2BB5|nr:glycosyltransferase [uncultured Chryseobacterium sp.]